MYANVIVNISSSHVDQMFEYLIPDEMNDFIDIGCRVTVPFGQGDRGVMGYVLEIYPEKRFQGDNKTIIELLDLKRIITEEQITLAKFIKEDTISPMCRVLNMMIPSALKTKTYKYLQLKNVGVLEPELLSLFKNNNIIEYNASLGIPKLKIDKAIKSGALELSYNTKQNSNYVYEDKYYLKPEFYNEALINTKKEEIRDFIKICLEDKLCLSKKDYLASYDISLYQLNKLINNGYFGVKKERVIRIHERNIPTINRKLNDESLIIDKFKASTKPVLFIPKDKDEELDVIFNLIKDVTDKGKNIVIFVPHILTSIKLASIIRKTFNTEVACLNSLITQGEYLDYYTNLLDDLYPVIITTPISALLPYKNVGMYVMIDEENDNYYNDQSPRYSLHKIIYFLSHNYHVPFVLSSVAPSVNSYCFGLKGSYEIVDNSVEVKNSNVIVADLKEEIKKGNNTYLSTILKNKMDEALSRDEQILLLANNQNYASYCLCRSCGETVKCPKCNLSLNYNEKKNLLICPACGYRESFKNKCENCGSDKLWFGGIGAEQITSVLKNMYPSKRVLQLQDDNFNEYLDDLNKIMDHECDIIITSERIARGAIDEKVMMVGIINFDSVLKTPSYEANSKAYTTLVNAESFVKAGGHLIVQTSFVSASPLINFISGSYLSFVKDEISVRKMAYLEPFYHINRIIIKTRKLDGFKIASDIVFTIKNLCGNKVFIPGYTYSKADQGVVVTIKHKFPQINQIYNHIYEKFQKDDVVIIFDKYPQEIVGEKMLKIIFMGTPSFSVPILEALIKEYEVVAVVTQPDKIGGRGHGLITSPVKECATMHNLKIYQPEHIKDVYDELINLNADLIVTAAYGQFVGEKLLKAPTFKAINCHASILPKYRGGSPIHAAIKNGDKETGVTIMYMEKKMDAGDILAVKKIPILDSDNVGTMFEKLSIVGRDLLLETIPLLVAGKITPIKQNEDEATFAYNITSEEELVDFNQDARKVFNHIRAYNPFPVAHMKLDGEDIKLYDSIVLDEATNEKPGTLIINQKGHLKVACGNNTVLEILSLKRPGKKQMSGRDFLNGYKAK